VLLLDIGLPGMGGLSAIELFKRSSPSMQVIMLTVFDMDEKVVTALRNGASGYLLKTSGMADIIRAVESSVQGGLPLDPMVTRNLLRTVQPPPKRSSKEYGLTDREIQILRYLVEGYSFQDIANRMFVSISTINWHVQNINEKLNVHSRSLAVSKALKEGLV
jgi:DNA-binding NarL/FixJ family response regulator